MMYIKYHSMHYYAIWHFQAVNLKESNFEYLIDAIFECYLCIYLIIWNLFPQQQDIIIKYIQRCPIEYQPVQWLNILLHQEMTLTSYIYKILRHTSTKFTQW